MDCITLLSLAYKMAFLLISKAYPLILASASPRRQALLSQVGLPFRALRSRVNEEGVPGGPMEVACSLARKKAAYIHGTGIDGWILGADTIVVIDDTVLGKPKSKPDARRMLSTLSGRKHMVITGISILNPAGAEVLNRSVSTMVIVKALTAGEIEAYLATGEPFGKAGSYAIQGIGAFMIQEIRGSYSNVVGLPICEVIEALKDACALGAFP